MNREALLREDSVISKKLRSFHPWVVQEKFTTYEVAAILKLECKAARKSLGNKVVYSIGRRKRELQRAHISRNRNPLASPLIQFIRKDDFWEIARLSWAFLCGYKLSV
jgi:hypothetical protein